MNGRDLATSGIIYVCALLLLQLWLIGPRQDRIRKSFANALRIPLRLAAPVSLLHAAIAVFGVPVWKGYAAYGALDVLLTVFVGFPVPLTSAVLQWVLGWPSFDEWQPERRSIFTPEKEPLPEPAAAPPESQQEPPRESTLVGRTGVAVTPLAPAGKVRVDGQTYAAHSDGQFIDRDMPVRVVGEDGFGALAVEPE